MILQATKHLLRPIGSLRIIRSRLFQDGRRPLAGFRRLRFSFFSDEPTLTSKSLEHPCPFGFGDLWVTACVLWLEVIGPVAQLVRARA